MASQVISSLLIPPQNASSINNGDTRPLANFPPSTWGDYFLAKTFETMEGEDSIEEKVEELTEKVRNLLITCAEKPSQQLSLIDSIQRLGVAYHFDTEINEALDHVYKNYNDINDESDEDLYTDINDESDEDLYTTGLKFRLLRQQRYSISCEIFNKFIDDKGNFKESLAKDVRGMLSLYEASHIRVHGEDVPERAFAFTTTNLRAAINNASHEGSCVFAAQVSYALKWPLFKAMPRLTARQYISFHEEDPLHHPALLSFAKLDYNCLQKLYQKELHEISRWWKDLKLVEELSFARNRCVECYIWALGLCFEPKYSLSRRITSKIAMIASILDDIYDAYGTFEELQLFTSAIERWDINCIERLPKYMKVCYEALMDIYRGIEQDISKDDIPYAIHYAKEAMKKQAKYFYIEAKWYHDGYIPTVEEYLRVARVTCYYLLSPISFLGMGDAASIEAFEWIESDPKSLIASGVISRIMNDITSHKFEQERGHVASAMECYMTQDGISEKQVREELEKQVTNAWKDMVEDYMQSVDVPNNIFMRVVNLARISNFFYKDEDGYTHPDGEIKLFITSLLVHPIPI